MSWSYSPVLVEEYLEVCRLDTEQFVPLKTTPMPDQFYSHGKPTEYSRLSRFGMTCEPLTDDLGTGLLTWYLEASHARTLVQQEKAKELKESDQACGKKCQESLAKYDHVSHGWKTAQCSLLGDSDELLQTLPRWGMTRNGVLSELPALVPTTIGNESGSLLATPTCTSNQLAPSMMKHAGCRKLAKTMLPTPTCHNAKEGNYPAEKNKKTPLLATHVGGKIHPQFTEWMMGWPIGWTDLKPLEMDKFHYPKK